MKLGMLLAPSLCLLAGCLEDPSGAEAYFTQSTALDGSGSRNDPAALPGGPPSDAEETPIAGEAPGTPPVTGGGLLPVANPEDDDEAPTGGDPSPLSPPPPQERRLRLEWVAPSKNSDGTPIRDLAGFRVYDGRQPGRYTMVTEVGDITEFTFDDLDSGTYFVAVTAYDEHGNESDFSDEIRIEVE